VARSYESLTGAVGRSVFFRPDRQRVRELLSRDAKPKLIIDGDEFPIFDISMNGVSFLSPEGSTDWRVGNDLRLSLLLHEEEVYKGPARVARVEHGPRGVRVALGLSNGFLDLPEMRRRDDEKRLDRTLVEGSTEIEKLVPMDYRAIVGRIAYFFQYHRRSLNYHEQRLRAEGAGDEGILELARRVADALREPRRELELQAAEVAVTFLNDRDVLAAAKDYTETLLMPLVRDVPHDNRAYVKPLGYPGDYQIMQYYYNDDFEGESVFAKVIHKLSIEHPLCAGVRGRKELIVDLIRREHQRMIAEKQGESDFRVVGIGCGPAREASDYIARERNWPGAMIWTLIDQEEKALSVAYRASQREISRSASNCNLNLLNLSFIQMLSEGLPLRDPGSQNFIFSTGLIDYVRKSRAQTLLRGIYDLLAPGGLMAIGNALSPNNFFWAAELYTDWSLIYRTRDEMQDLARLLPDEAQVEMTLDPAEAYYFLLVRKPSQVD